MSANVGWWSRGRGGTWRAGVNPWPAPKPQAKFSPSISKVLSPAWRICCSIRVPPAPQISGGSSSIHLSFLQSGVTSTMALSIFPPFSRKGFRQHSAKWLLKSLPIPQADFPKLPSHPREIPLGFFNSFFFKFCTLLQVAELFCQGRAVKAESWRFDVGLCAVTRRILGGRSSSCINLKEGKSLKKVRNPRCWVSIAFPPPPLQVPSPVPCVGRDGPSGAGGCPTRRCVPQQRVTHTSRAGRAAGRWGMQEGCRAPCFCPCDGHTALQLLPCSSWPLGLHGHFPLTVLMALIPWVHNAHAGNFTYL